jgi:hypothetical protein
MATKRKTTTYTDDPVVREVRETRARMCEEAGGTIEGLMRLVHEEVPEKPSPRKPRRRKRT